MLRATQHAQQNDFSQALSRGLAPVAILHTPQWPGRGTKMQVAIEYVYRYAQNYQAVLWTRADSRGLLVSGFVELARLLKLT